MTHGVDGGDVARPDVAVVDGCGSFRDPVRVLPVRVGSDLLKQPKLHWATLVVPPGGQTVGQSVGQSVSQTVRKSGQSST